jgi:hypothetical protein
VEYQPRRWSSRIRSSGKDNDSPQSSRELAQGSQPVPLPFAASDFLLKRSMLALEMFNLFF